MSQKRKYVRRQKKNNPMTSIPRDATPDVEQIANPSINSTSIISEQDEDYEISVIMDIIKIQEKEEKEKIEKEIEIQKKHLQELQAKINQRDNNIKEILRKIKVASGQTSIENTIVNLLEKLMQTQEMCIQLDNIKLYEEISSYLGIKDNTTKGVIRLTDDIKMFAKNTFIFSN